MAKKTEAPPAAAGVRNVGPDPPKWTALLLVVAVWGVFWGVARFFGVVRVQPEETVFTLSGFLVLGAVSGAYLLWEMRRAPSRRFRLALMLAYLLVMPIAAFSGLQGPMVVVNPLWHLLTIPALGLFPSLAGVKFAVWISESAMGSAQ